VGLERAPRLGVDVGTVRVGVAVSDPDGILATPVETVPRGEAEDGGVARVVEIVREHGAGVVYVGLPRALSGSDGSSSQAARTYGVHLARAAAPVPVRLVDERMSTVVAHRAMHASGRPGRRHRAVVDQVAAVVILQSALDAERARGERAGEPVMIEPVVTEQDEAGVDES
jgi:putative Holliday junction resolvase